MTASPSQLPPQTMAWVDKAGNIASSVYRYLQDLHQYSGLAKLNFPLYDDLVVPATMMRADASSPPGFDAFQGNVRAFAFDAATDEYLHFIVQLPHGYIPGSDVQAYVQWAPSDTDAGTVRWVIDYTWASVDASFAAPTSIAIEDAGSGTAYQHQAASYGTDIAGDAQGVSSVIIGRVYRNAGHVNDTYAADAFLLSVGFHFVNAAHGTVQPWP